LLIGVAAPNKSADRMANTTKNTEPLLRFIRPYAPLCSG
jgi:hypothetical protein